MKNTILFALIFSSTALAGCDPEQDVPRLADQQIVCTLKGEAYIFLEGYEKSVHSVRSRESDSLCQPLKSILKPEPPKIQQEYKGSNG